MSWLHEEIERGKVHAALVQLLLDIYKYLSACVPEGEEVQRLRERIINYTRNPL